MEEMEVLEDAAEAAKAENGADGQAAEEGAVGAAADCCGISEADSVAGIEALIFASGEGLSQERILEITRLPQDVVLSALEAIRLVYAVKDRGFELVVAAGQYQFRTKAEFSPLLKALKAERPRRLSYAALETLAVIAYRQPIVKSDIEKIRGVDATPTLKTLLERQLIRIVGHKAAVGQPALYGTTDQFLKLFGLNSLAELPTLRDLKQLESDPGEIGERLGELEQAAEEAGELLEQEGAFLDGLDAHAAHVVVRENQ